MLIAGNWKMNGSWSENEDLVRDLLALPSKAERVVCPPALYLAQVAGLIRESDIRLGAQNIDWHDAGAFTGEISAAMVRDVGATHVIIGHSERRALFGEGVSECLEKTKAAIAEGLTPIFCVGETKAERDSGGTRQVISAQLVDVIEMVPLDKMIIAYEPVWAIGTGDVATPEQAEEVHRHIRELVSEKDPGAAATMRILYGGSVNAENAAGLFERADIDGALVGGASLKAKDFSAICCAATDK
ncbi:MAG: triosephosphate isomerase [Candidatus Azotimanducaceae bacterium]|jgi:triosephosphate isomerase